MKRRLISALISTSLIIPGTVIPMPVWANAGIGQTIPQSVADAQAKWEQGSAGFFQYLANQGDTDATLAYRIITAKNGSLQDGAKKSTDYSSFTRLGQDKDATSLENMKISIEFLEKTNEKRQEENRTMKTSLKDLRVSSSLMAISQWQTNASRETIGHSQAFNVGENLSWGYTNPFDGWYDEEKAVYLDAQKSGTTPDPNDVGHYLNIVNSSYQVMGTAAIEDGHPRYGRVSGGTFGFSGGKYAAKTYTVAQYKQLFMNYYNDLKSQMEPVKTDLSSATVSGISSQYEYRGQSISPVPTVTLNGSVLTKDSDYTVSWSNNTGPGTARVTITGIGDYTGTLSVTFEICEPARTDLSSAVVSGIYAQYIYQGQAISPDPTVTLNGSVLAKNTDYTVSWSNNTGPGTARITITGIGDYTGTLSVTYEILEPVKTDLSSATVSGINAQYEYQGQAILPDPTVILHGSVLEKNTDYTVSWSNNTGPGTARVTIIGIGNYTGTVTVTFEIAEPEQPEIPVDDPNIVHRGMIGTAEWTIDRNGILTIGEGEFINSTKYYDWPWSDYLDSVGGIDGTKSFKIDGRIDQIFSGATHVKQIDLSGWDTSSVIDMSSAFYNCCELKEINLSSWDTSSVQSMEMMFGVCQNLTSIDVGGFDTSSVTDMFGMFMQCSSLKELSISSWNIQNVIDMAMMFSGCKNLSELSLDNWDTSSVLYLTGMFESCEALTSLNLNLWDTSSVETMANMFYGCQNLETIGLSSWDTGAVKNMISMFNGCGNLSSLDLGSWNTSSVTDMMLMFSRCENLKSIDLSSWDTGNVEYLNDIFLKCKSLSQIRYSSRSADILNKLPEQSGWYQNNNGPYSISNLPEVAAGQTALLTRTRTEPARTSIEYKSITSGVNSSYPYTGKPVTPKPSVSVNGKALVEGTDYTLSYSNNVNPGTATITITGTGNYYGTISKTFTITKSTPAKPAASQIGSASVTGIGSSYSYTGKAIAPKPVVTLVGKQLTEGTDYTVSYSSNINPGTATITITGTGGYTGTITKTFTITKQSPAKPTITQIGSASVTGINSSYSHTGKAIMPKPVVTLNGKRLIEGTDYTVSYSNNVNPGKAAVTITGKGNYTGVITKIFEIVKPAADQPAETVKGVSMFRLYNPNSGEHFYTANPEEKDHLVVVGWKDEGIGWTAPETSKIPVYRLYNPNAGDHHYTMSREERDALVKIGWNDEGIGWYSDEKQGVPLYRQYNPNAVAGSHNYTIDKGENDGLVRLGWKAEGIGWYGVK